MKKNNKCCIGILKWQLFWEKEKVLKRQILWDEGSIKLLLDCILSCAYSTDKRMFKAVKFSKSLLEVAKFNWHWKFSIESCKLTGS